jgi:hypothetical protein
VRKHPIGGRAALAFVEMQHSRWRGAPIARVRRSLGRVRRDGEGCCAAPAVSPPWDAFDDDCCDDYQ